MESLHQLVVLQTSIASSIYMEPKFGQRPCRNYSYPTEGLGANHSNLIAPVRRRTTPQSPNGLVAVAMPTWQDNCLDRIPWMGHLISCTIRPCRMYIHIHVYINKHLDISDAWFSQQKSHGVSRQFQISVA